MTDAVNLCCSVRLSTVSFRMSSFMVLYMWSSFTLYRRQLFRIADGKTCSVTLVQNMFRHPCPKHVPSPLSFTYFIHITCPLLHTSVSLYTDWLWSLFSKEAGILFAWVYVFNVLDRWLVFIGSASDEASLRLPHPFFPYINSTSPSFSSISTLLIFWRERPSPTFRQLYFRQLIRRRL